MAFIRERFPTIYSYEPDGGPQYNSTITQTEGGQEARSPAWGSDTGFYGLSEFMLASRPLTGKWGAQTSNWTATPRGDYNALYAFWNTIAQGQNNGFLFQFWFDNYASRSKLLNTVTGQLSGDGTTITFQLCKQYTSPGGSGTSNRKIFTQLGTNTASITELLNVNQTGLPTITSTTTAPLIYADANPVSSPLTPTTAYSINTSGLVTFTTAPANASTPTATFYFDWPVRFDNNKLPISYKKGVYTLEEITLLELRDLS